MSSPFAPPGTPSDPINWSEYMGALLIVKPLSIETGIQTVHGAASAIRASVSVLDGPNGGKRMEDVLVFPRMLQAQLKTRIGQMVLGRLGQGQAKPGQTAPWVLNAATPDDEQTAQRFLSQSSAPSAPAAAPAAQSWSSAPAQPPF